MADLFTPERFQLGLRFQLARHGGEPSPGITQMTDILLAIARKWVEVDPEQYEILHARAKADRMPPERADADQPAAAGPVRRPRQH